MKMLMFITMGAILLAIPFIGSSHLISFLVIILLFSAFAEAWNLMAGYCGQFSLGHAAFLGLGAYVPVILFLNYGISPWLSMWLAVFLSLGLAIIMGYSCFKLKAIWFALATLGISEILRLSFLTVFRDITNGATGLYFIPFTENSFVNLEFTTPAPFFFFALALCLISILVSHKLMKSKEGLYFLSIRENEDAAESVGVNTYRYKFLAFFISAAIVTLVGTFYAFFVRFITPDIMAETMSINILLMTVVGGIGTLIGPVIGVVALLTVKEFLRIYVGEIASLYVVILGVLVIVIVKYLPSGVVSLPEKIRKFGWKQRA